MLSSLKEKSSSVAFDLLASAYAFCVRRRTKGVEGIKPFGTQSKTEGGL